MKIEELRIHQQFLDEHNIVQSIAEIHENGTVIDTWGTKYKAENIQPMKDQPYITIDNFGHISLCLQSENNTLMADVDTIKDCGYNAMYIVLRPNNADGTIDIAALKESTTGDKNLEIKVWGNSFSEDPSETLTLYHEDICKALEIDE